MRLAVLACRCNSGIQTVSRVLCWHANSRTPPGDRPLECSESRSALSAVGQRDRSLEIGRANGQITARADLFGAFSGVRRGEGDTFDAATGAGEECSRGRVVLGRIKHAQQFEIILAEHHRVIAGSHLGAVGAARRDGKAQPLPVLRGAVEVVDDDDGMIDPDDVLQRHFPRLRGP